METHAGSHYALCTKLQDPVVNLMSDHLSFLSDLYEQEGLHVVYHRQIPILDLAFFSAMCETLLALGELLILHGT